MKDGGFTITGEPISVQVLNAAQRSLEGRLKESLEGRTIERVMLLGDQLTLTLDNGESFSMACAGGFHEVQ